MKKWLAINKLEIILNHENIADSRIVIKTTEKDTSGAIVDIEHVVYFMDEKPSVHTYDLMALDFDADTKCNVKELNDDESLVNVPIEILKRLQNDILKEF